MAEINPPLAVQGGPDAVGSVLHDALLVRRALGNIFQEGVSSFDGNDDMKVAVSAGMTLRVSRGGAYIQGDNVLDQGLYFVYNDGNVFFTASNGDPSDPRKDIVVARIRDASHGITGDDWLLEYIEGTPDSSPQEPAIPLSALRLATVDVAAGVSSITDNDITDRRSKSILLGPGVGTVTDSKIAPEAITSDKIVPGTIESRHLVLDPAVVSLGAHHTIGTTEQVAMGVVLPFSPPVSNALVIVDAEIRIAFSSGTNTLRLKLDGVNQTGTIVTSISGTGGALRKSSSHIWVITGIANGSRVFELSAQATSSTNHDNLLASTGTQMMVIPYAV